MTPAPYPADTRAKGWRFEIDLERVRQSDTWALASPELRPWLFMLWATAWEQSPCGSLPNDDALIVARIGMPTKMWPKAKAVLMRGWEAHDDGRLYHATISALVLSMLAAKDRDRTRKSEYRARSSAARDAMSRGTDAGLPCDSEGLTRPSASCDDTGTSTSTSTSIPSATNVLHPTVGEQTPKTAAKAAPTQRGSRLPPDWTLPKAWGEWAISKYPQWPEQKVRDEATKFRNHWTALTGKAATKIDWRATWENWCMNDLAHRDDTKPRRSGPMSEEDRRAANAAANTEAKRLLGFTNTNEVLHA